MQKVVYYIFLALVWILQILPKSFRRGFFFALSRTIYFLSKKANKIIKANLDFVFSNNKLSSSEIQKIQKYSFYNMSLWVLSMIENFNVSDEEVKKNVSIENQEIIDNLLKENKKVIILSAHYGNLEVLGFYLNKFVSPMVQVARESNFKLIDNFIIKSREKCGAQIVYKDGALRYLVRALNKNKVVSLILDQSINSKEGIEVVFLGKKCNQATSAANLARKFDAYVVPVAIFNKDDYKYNIKVYEAIKPIKTKDEKNDIQILTQMQADAMSKIILEDKKQWFWPHKRFKVHNKEIYE